MPLTDEQKRAIREEESYRNEIRKELASAGGPPAFLARLSAFFETKVGFWLLTTLLAGITATSFASLQRYMDRHEIARRDRAERSLRDAETLLKLAPMLTSEKVSEVKIAVVLLNGLSADAAVDATVAARVKTLIEEAVQAGSQKDATPEERARTAAIISYADKPRMEAIQATDAVTSPAPAPPRDVESAIDKAALPVRVYIQIGGQSDRPRAERARLTLQDAGLVTPGIELVRAAPKQDSVRYCADKVTPDALERVRAAVAKLDPIPAFNVLDPRFCGNVRSNHFELWFARPG